MVEMKGGVTDAGQTTNERTNEQTNSEHRATQPMEAGGWVSQLNYWNIFRPLFPPSAPPAEKCALIVQVTKMHKEQDWVFILYLHLYSKYFLILFAFVKQLFYNLNHARLKQEMTFCNFSSYVEIFSTTI